MAWIFVAGRVGILLLIYGLSGAAAVNGGAAAPPVNCVGKRVTVPPVVFRALCAILRSEDSRPLVIEVWGDTSDLSRYLLPGKGRAISEPSNLPRPDTEVTAFTSRWEALGSQFRAGRLELPLSAGGCRFVAEGSGSTDRSRVEMMNPIIWEDRSSPFGVVVQICREGSLTWEQHWIGLDCDGVELDTCCLGQIENLRELFDYEDLGDRFCRPVR